MCQVCAAVLVMGASKMSQAVGYRQSWTENPQLTFYMRCRYFWAAEDHPGGWQMRREGEQWPSKWRHSFNLAEDMKEIGIHAKWSELSEAHRQNIEQWVDGKISQYSLISYRSWFGR